MNICRVCNRKIEVAIFKGTGICSVNCQKREKGEKEVPSRVELLEKVP